jgi:NhaP-type Na+/H+ or K+/H+ antiporter
VLPAHLTNQLEVMEMQIVLIPILVFMVFVFIAGSILVMHALYSVVLASRRPSNQARSEVRQGLRHHSH